MKKILIADEFLPDIQEHRGILGRANFQIFTAGTAEEALGLHRDERMDLIMVALDMPVMGGDGLCSAIRQDESPRQGKSDMQEKSDKKVYISLVCPGRKPELRRCESCGADSSVTSPEALMEKVARVLGVPERRDKRVLIKVTVNGRFKTEPFFCTSGDVSVSGILLETEKTLARGDAITCSFFLPDAGGAAPPAENRIDAKGEVTRVVKAGDCCNYGVRFLNLPPESREAMEAFVKWQGGQ